MVIEKNSKTSRIAQSMLVAFLAVVLFCVVAPKSAHGAQAPAPLIEDGTMRVMLYPGVDGSTTAVLVQYTIPSTTVLPARVRIPIPAGAHIGWVGEISLKTGPDTQRSYTIKNEGGNEFVEFTLSQSKIGQVDLSGLALTVQNGTLNARLDWKQASAAKTTQFEVRLPAKVHGVSISPKPQASPDRNKYGETLYSLPSRSMNIGDEQSIVVSYKNGAGIGPMSYQGVLIAAAVLLGIIAVVMILFALKRPKKMGE